MQHNVYIYVYISRVCPPAGFFLLLDPKMAAQVLCCPYLRMP